MAPKLVAEEGPLKGLVFSLEGEEITIGRDPDVSQLVLEDPSVSRKHLVYRQTPEGIVLENLSITNPVQVNQTEVREPRLLQNGDTVKIGNGLFRYYTEAAAQVIKEATPSALSSSSHSGEASPSQAGEKEPKNPQVAKLSKERMPMDQSQMQQEKKGEEPAAIPSEHQDRHDSIYDEESSHKDPLAQINFGMVDTGRWLLKVIGGPNNGAEFSIHSGGSYVIGTDPNTCEIVFHDTSVSRQHARISVGEDEAIAIEDLKSRNGTVVDGEVIKSKHALPANTVVSLGTTSFVIYDREGEMQTIISPLMPSIVKVLQSEEQKKSPEERAADQAKAQQDATAAEKDRIAKAEAAARHHPSTLGAYLLIGILTGLIILVAVGTSTLFKSEAIPFEEPIDPNQTLDAALKPFPSVKFTFNKNTGQLLLVGHVITTSDRNELLYSLRGMNFIKTLDDSGLVIDEYVWREENQIIEKNPEWKGINVMSTSPGHFVVTGYLKSRTQADRLSEFLSANFPYPDLLEKKIIIDEEVITAINNLFLSKGIKTVNVKLENGEVLLSGGVPRGKEHDFDAVLKSIKDIRGVRSIRNLSSVQAPESSMINISDKYEVTGVSRQGGNLSVIVNGRILMKGDILDGMSITKIDQRTIYLEKGGVNYRIDFNQ